MNRANKVNINFRIRAEKRQKFKQICQSQDKTITQAILEHIDRVIKKSDQAAA